MTATATRHVLRWREYGIEAWALGSFMISACVFGALVFHPGSPLATALASAMPRRALMGMLMGLTLVSLVYSPWGKRSGAHMNPAKCQHESHLYKGDRRFTRKRRPHAGG